MFHVYRRTDMESVHTGTLPPGDALSFDDAVSTAARLCGRSTADVSRFARKIRSGPHRPRVFIAGRPRDGGYIIAREDDPARCKRPGQLRLLP